MKRGIALAAVAVVAALALTACRGNDDKSGGSDGKVNPAPSAVASIMNR